MGTRLHELLDLVTFDELVPTLKKVCEKDPRKINGQLPHFKMAFDELGMIEPEINDNTINVGLTESFICVEGCQDHWNTVLGKIIILSLELFSQIANWLLMSYEKSLSLGILKMRLLNL